MFGRHGIIGVVALGLFAASSYAEADTPKPEAPSKPAVRTLFRTATGQEMSPDEMMAWLRERGFTEDERAQYLEGRLNRDRFLAIRARRPDDAAWSAAPSVTVEATSERSERSASIVTAVYSQVSIKGVDLADYHKYVETASTTSCEPTAKLAESMGKIVDEVLDRLRGLWGGSHGHVDK